MKGDIILRKTDYYVVKQYVEELGYDLISKEYLNNAQKLILRDKDGYYYVIRWADILKGYKPRFVHKANPYSIDNIKLFLKINNSKLTLLSETFEGEDVDLKLSDNEGYYYSSPWCNIKELKGIAIVSKINTFSNQNIQLFLDKRNMNFKLISSFTDSNIKLNLIDKYGYLFSISWTNLHAGKTPQFVEKNNPHSVHNIKLFLKINNYDFTLLSEIYEGEDIPLILLDSEGYYYSQTWRTLLKLTRQLFVSDTNTYSTQNIILFLTKNNSKLELISKYKNSKTKLVLRDINGYLYTQSWGDTQYLRMPSLAYKGNPYSIQNIKLWCKLNNKPYKLLSMKYIKNNKLLLWKCLDNDCGEEFKMCWANISQGQNCSKCKLSKGERRIRNYLKQNSIPHDKEYTFDNLVGLRGGLLRFDVPIFYDADRTKLKMLIEFDGEQHDKWVNGWMTKKEFRRLQIHDKLKDEYCKNNNIRLLRIKWCDFDNIEAILTKELNILAKVS